VGPPKRLRTHTPSGDHKGLSNTVDPGLFGPRIRRLEALIDKLSTLGATSTSTVLSSPVERREYRAKQVEVFAKNV
jgi:hypothetical protein